MNPKGKIVDTWGTVKKVLEQLAGMDPKLQPYVGRAVSIMEAGVAEATGGSGGPQQTSPLQSPAIGAEAKPPEGAAFPG